MWKHFQAGGLGATLKPPEANRFYTFTEYFSTLKMTRCSIFVYELFYSMILPAKKTKKQK